MAAEEKVLSETAAKLLGDKHYEKRMQAAFEIEAQTRDSVARYGSNHTQVQKLLDCLKRDYVESLNPNFRKGGLIGLASVAIGLERDVRLFLPQLVKPVLDLFQDDDARVRFYACEAMYNVSKRCDDAILAHFNPVFNGLCMLYADVDQEVVNGVQHLDRLMKDIAMQYAPQFRAQDFIPLLAQRMHRKSPCVRQLVLAWVSLLMTVPEVDMVVHLPQYLEGLFNMLGDPSRDVKQNADSCLNELLCGAHGIKEIEHEKAEGIITSTSSIVVRACFAGESCTRLTALVWVHEFVGLQTEAMRTSDSKPAESWIGLLPSLLSGALHCIDDQEEIAARMAVEVHQELLEMVDNLTDDVPVSVLVDKLLDSMQSKAMVVRTACLQWVCMLLSQSPAQMLQHDSLHKLFDPVFDTLLHPEDEVVVAALRVLARIMEGRDTSKDDMPLENSPDLFTDVTHRLLRLFASDRRMFESRGRVVIRQLCGHLDSKRLYVTVARAIARETDTDFAQELVQTFSWILLTAKETKSLRDELRSVVALPTQLPVYDASSNGEAPGNGTHSLFVELLVPWFHNPVSALALCLWAQQYALAEGLTVRFASCEPTLDLLKQLDQLVHLLESPVFTQLRLQLLEPRRHPSLIRCLLGLAMLLPQASAFQILRERIHIVQSGLLLEAQQRESRPPAANASSGEPGGLLGIGLWRTNSPPEGSIAGSQQSLSKQQSTAKGVSPDDVNSLLQRFDQVMAATSSLQ